MLAVITAVFLVATSSSDGNDWAGNIGADSPMLAGIHPLMYIIGIPVAVVGCYNLVTGYLASRPQDDRLRNPETGVVEGAEAFDLGPDGAPGVVLLVHGFIGSVRDYGDLPQKIAAAGWHVRAMRLPGHGTRPQDLEKESQDSLIRAVLAEYDSLRLAYGKVVLAGHSMGGTLAVLAASERNPDALVLAAPYFRVTGKWYYGFSPETWTTLLDPFIRWTYKGDHFTQLNRREAAPNIISYRWVPLKGAMILSELGDSARRQEVLESISCPVLVIHSHNDMAASPEASHAAYEIMTTPQKRFVWLERSNHLIFWDYDREKVTDEILNFIGRR